MQSSDKKLDAMNRLADMAHFPAAVNAGATLNILLTLTATWLLVPRYPRPFAPLLWILLVLTLNLLPVLLLRLTDPNTRPMSTLATMDFFRDQHRFSDWVYLAASANMAFWILLGWTVFASFPGPHALAALLVLAALVTFSPVLLRRR